MLSGTDPCKKCSEGESLLPEVLGLFMVLFCFLPVRLRSCSWVLIRAASCSFLLRASSVQFPAGFLPLCFSIQVSFGCFFFFSGKTPCLCLLTPVKPSLACSTPYPLLAQHLLGHTVLCWQWEAPRERPGTAAPGGRRCLPHQLGGSCPWEGFTAGTSLPFGAEPAISLLSGVSYGLKCVLRSVRVPQCHVLSSINNQVVFTCFYLFLKNFSLLIYFWR